MSEAECMPGGPAEAARALVGAPVRPCPGCGGPLEGRRRACSARCRAALSRRRREEARRERDREIRGLLVAALRALGPEGS